MSLYSRPFHEILKHCIITINYTPDGPVADQSLILIAQPGVTLNDMMLTDYEIESVETINSLESSNSYDYAIPAYCYGEFNDY